jgi:hypothetical protein
VIGGKISDEGRLGVLPINMLLLLLRLLLMNSTLLGMLSLIRASNCSCSIDLPLPVCPSSSTGSCRQLLW